MRWRRGTEHMSHCKRGGRKRTECRSWCPCRLPGRSQARHRHRTRRCIPMSLREYTWCRRGTGWRRNCRPCHRRLRRRHQCLRHPPYHRRRHCFLLRRRPNLLLLRCRRSRHRLRRRRCPLPRALRQNDRGPRGRAGRQSRPGTGRPTCRTLSCWRRRRTRHSHCSSQNSLLGCRWFSGAESSQVDQSSLKTLTAQPRAISNLSLSTSDPPTDRQVQERAKDNALSPETMKLPQPSSTPGA